MTLALTATAASSRLSSGYVALSVTGAAGDIPVGSPVYTANFSAGYDSWAGGTDSSPAAPTTTGRIGSELVPGYVSSGVYDWSSDQQYLGRTITGLTIGHVYRVTAQAGIFVGPPTVLLYLQVPGIGAGDPVSVDVWYHQLTYSFTATATSHVVRFRRTTGTATSLKIRSVSVQRISAMPNSPLTITRSDNKGKSFVRLQTGQVPDSAGALSVNDYETAFHGCTYRVIDSLGNVATTTIDPYAQDSAAGPVQIVAVGTSACANVARIDMWDRELAYRDSGSSLAILGRTGPVITTRSDNQWTKRQGTLTFYCADESAAQGIVAVYQASRVVLVRTEALSITDMYHVASSVRIVPATLRASGDWTFAVEVEYQEVGWPEGDLAGASWTYADVLATNLAYFDLPPGYATYADLAAG